VYRGATWFSSSVMHTLTLPATPSPTHSRIHDLTVREWDILREIARGASNQEIALHLHLAEQTIRNNTTRIYEKLGVSSRAEAIIWAFQSGLGKEMP
jgi:DNA-binding NarL/FixJ family response regulator